MTGLITTARSLLDDLAQQAERSTPLGALPDYVPILSQANPQAFGAAVWAIDGRRWERSQPGRRVVLMSVIKPLLLLYAQAVLGREAVRSLVDCHPSALPYNDLNQLLEDGGRPRNAMLNSGAIALAGAIPGQTARDRVRRFQDWLFQTTGIMVPVNETVLASVQALPNERNRMIAQTLAQFGSVTDPVAALDSYNRLCCSAIHLSELAQLGGWLADPPDDRAAIVHGTLEAMGIAGLYQSTNEWMVRVGWPAKSGVSGVMWAVQPGRGSIACYGPLLNPQGHSITGLAFVERAIDWF